MPLLLLLLLLLLLQQALEQRPDASYVARLLAKLQLAVGDAPGASGVPPGPGLQPDRRDGWARLAGRLP